MKPKPTACTQPPTPRTMSPEAFEALHARPALQLPASQAKSLHAATLAAITPEAAALVEKTIGCSSAPDIRYQYHGLIAGSLTGPENAAHYADTLDQELQRLADIADQLRALQAYYTAAAALLDSTEKRPAVILDRSEDRWSRRSGVTYDIHTGTYDITREKLVIEKRGLQHFSGKEHREARKAFAELLKQDAAALAFEIHNGWSDSARPIDRPA